MNKNAESYRRIVAAVADFFGGEIVSMEISEEKKRGDYNHWLAEAQERGWKPGWAAYQYKDQYGEWPPKEWKPVDSSVCPTCGAMRKKPEPMRQTDVPF